MNLTKKQFTDMLDLSIVQSSNYMKDVEETIETAKLIKPCCVYALPDLTPFMIEGLKEEKEVLVGGCIGYPDGGHTTSVKEFEAKEMLAMGCDEFDMVMKIGMLKSKMFKEVVEDIKTVKKTVGDKILKVIIETPVLTDEQIMDAAKCVLEGGADFVKTGSGWCGATEEKHLELIKKAIGDEIPIKAAGGVKTLDIASRFYDMGVKRFGIARAFTLNILKEFDELK